jgi:organic hydroperoxide reductase OsmC/OhrA
MDKLPHHYRVDASATPGGAIATATDEGAGLEVDAPAQFGGEPGGWSPEHLLTSSLASCFALTFKAIAAASGLEWKSLQAGAEGTLDKIDRAMQFTAFHIDATLTVPAGTNRDRAVEALERAERHCLVTNTLKCPVTLAVSIEIPD